MAYRGGDLDLRTPRTWSATAPDAPPAYEPRTRSAYTPGPIWVDEVVLTCVNHAYDVALAHRASEVGLEHLLHALTRIDAAAELLEIRGIRVAALRRESATLIASELPVGLTSGETGPRHSEELEHVLRAASLIASRRNAPAAVDDLLHLMLDVEPDLPGLALLARVDARAGAVNGSYARPARATFTGRYAAPATEPQTPPPAGQPSRTPRLDAAGTVIDSQQNSRLDALEQMVRTLIANLGTERNAQSNVLADLQRDVTNLRSSPPDVGPIADRVATIERSIAAGFEQFSLALASIENDLRARMQNFDIAPLGNRLEIIEEAVLSRDADKAIHEVSERLDRLETTLAGERTRAAEAGAVLRGEIGQLAQSVESHRSEIVSTVLPLANQLSEFRSIVESSQVDAGEKLRVISERLSPVERLVAETLQKVIDGQISGRDDLAEVSDAIVKLNANQHTLAGTIDQSRTEARENALRYADEFKVTAASLTGAVDAMAPRFADLQGETNRIAGTIEGLSGTVENMHRVTIERYYRRNRFWYWLFGTDDWVAASWPSQSNKIAEELKAVKSSHR